MENNKTNTATNKNITWVNFPDLCKGCGLCIEKCPKKCLKFSEEIQGFLGTPAVECDVDQCIACGICELNCPDLAIRVEEEK